MLSIRRAKLIDEIFINSDIVLNKRLYNKRTPDFVSQFVPYLSYHKEFFINMEFTLLSKVHKQLQEAAYYLLLKQV